MKIALLGYGKMGKTIENIALNSGHEIVLKVTSKNSDSWTNHELSVADVAIEFSRPEYAVSNILRCFESNVPVVSGTTGWLDEWENILSNQKSLNGGFFYASNFSIGVNIFFEINRVLAKMMASQNSFGVDIKEIHHTQKLDAPSGTAITIAEDILANLPWKNTWVKENNSSEDELSIFSERLEKVPGTHIVNYQSEIDSIEIKHTAHSRMGFAQGALMAAQFMVGKKGIFGMSDMMKRKSI